MPYLTINETEVPFVENQTLLEAASSAGIDIPMLYTDDCRLSIAEDVETGELLSSNSTLAEEGMHIVTESPKVFDARREWLVKVFSSGAHNCFTAKLPEEKCASGHVEARRLKWHDMECPAKGACVLQKLAGKHKVPVRDVPLRIETPVFDDRSPFIARDYSRCVKCGKCISVCDDIGQGAISRYSHNGSWYPMVDMKKCTHCGECLEACPVGALFDKKSYGIAKSKVAKVRTTCPYCGTGCQMDLHVKDGRIIRVTGAEDAAPNYGRLCVKGRFGYDFIHSEKRLTAPLIKENGEFREASWDEALDMVAARLSRIRDEHGADAIAGLSCARSTNEDSYNMQKLFRAVIGSNNIDHCART